jgi:hypothetical protein
LPHPGNTIGWCRLFWEPGSSGFRANRGHPRPACEAWCLCAWGRPAAESSSSLYIYRLCTGPLLSPCRGWRRLLCGHAPTAVLSGALRGPSVPAHPALQTAAPRVFGCTARSPLYTYRVEAAFAPVRRVQEAAMCVSFSGPGRMRVQLKSRLVQQHLGACCRGDPATLGRLRSGNNRRMAALNSYLQRFQELHGPPEASTIRGIENDGPLSSGAGRLAHRAPCPLLEWPRLIQNVGINSQGSSEAPEAGGKVQPAPKPTENHPAPERPIQTASRRSSGRDAIFKPYLGSGLRPGPRACGAVAARWRQRSGLHALQRLRGACSGARRTGPQ